MSVSPSVHLSTIQKVTQLMSVNKFNSLPVSHVSQYTIKTVSLSVINQATQLLINHHYFISESTIQTVTVLFKSKLTVRCES